MRMFASNFRLGGGCDEYQLVAGDAARDLLSQAKRLLVGANRSRLHGNNSRRLVDGGGNRNTLKAA
jgi:hypothetical protein